MASNQYGGFGKKFLRSSILKMRSDFPTDLLGVASDLLQEVIVAYLEGGKDKARDAARGRVSGDLTPAKLANRAAKSLDPLVEAKKEYDQLSDIDKKRMRQLSEKELRDEVEEEGGRDEVLWYWPGDGEVVSAQSTNVVMFCYVPYRKEMHVIFCNEVERTASDHNPMEWVYPRYYIYLDCEPSEWRNLRRAKSAGKWFWRNYIDSLKDFVVVWGPLEGGARRDPTTTPESLLPSTQLGV